jgi:RNA-directed DNA polymerase
MGAHPELPKSIAILLKQQKGKCARCGLVLTAEDIWENDHIVPVIAGGTDDLKNRQLLHRHCHDNKTREDGSLPG